MKDLMPSLGQTVQALTNPADIAMLGLLSGQIFRIVQMQINIAKPLQKSSGVALFQRTINNVPWMKFEIVQRYMQSCRAGV